MFCCKVFFASKKLLPNRVLHLPMYACHFSRLPRWLDLCCCIFYAGDAHYTSRLIYGNAVHTTGSTYKNKIRDFCAIRFCDNLSVQALIVKPFESTLCYIRFRDHAMPIYIFTCQKYNCSLHSNYGTHLFWIKLTGKLISPGSFWTQIA